MDPNATLAEIRRLRLALTEAADGDSNDDEIELGQELADAFELLDGWLSNGGFLPRAWQPKG